MQNIRKARKGKAVYTAINISGLLAYKLPALVTVSSNNIDLMKVMARNSKF